MAHSAAEARAVMLTRLLDLADNVLPALDDALCATWERATQTRLCVLEARHNTEAATRSALETSATAERLTVAAQEVATVKPLQ